MILRGVHNTVELCDFSSVELIFFPHAVIGPLIAIMARAFMNFI
jgi:hypothetical protein